MTEMILIHTALAGLAAETSGAGGGGMTGDGTLAMKSKGLPAS